MKTMTSLPTFALGTFLTVGATALFAVPLPQSSSSSQSAKQNMQTAGHQTKSAAQHAGRSVKQGTRSAYHSTKRGTKKAWNKTRNTTKGAVDGGKAGARQPSDPHR